MIELQTDLWTMPADARCITTNGSLVKVTGRPHTTYRGVMGRGCAAQAKQRWPAIELDLGFALRAYGNVVSILKLELPSTILVRFPVKHQWHEPADLTLITASVCQLVALVNAYGWKTVALPRPGCGNGRLTWEDVRPVCAELDDRFIVVHQ